MQPEDIENALVAAGIHPTSVIRVEEVGDGWECRVFRVGRDGVDDVALRLYTADPSGGTMRTEVAAYRALEQIEYPAPRLLAQHESRDPLGAPFVLIDWLDGPLADSLGASHEALDELTGLLVRLHDITPDREAAARHAVAVRTNRDLPAGRSAALDEGDLDGFRPALQWLAERARDIEAVPLSYVHMDFHPRNVILTRRGPVVIDWGGFAITDPRSDLAWSLLLAEAYMGSDTAARILSAYANRRPDGLEDLSFFRVSAVWRRLATITVMLREGLPPGVKDQVLEGVRLLEPAYRSLTEATGTTINEVEGLYT
ncbi:MAG: aminoglycoside phosphotransferase family protein [Acidimicrobiia bacterium]|nr:aminoglycoside phosphotransferase family protein [Acidimicrobiia bacterium]